MRRLPLDIFFGEHYRTVRNFVRPFLSARNTIRARYLIGAVVLSSGCVPLPISSRVNIVSVAGTVLSRDSRKPIPHARVTVMVSCDQVYLREIRLTESLVASTDEHGEFMLRNSGTHSRWLRFPLLPPFPGEHGWSSSIEVVVNAQGYEPFSRVESQKGMLLSTRPDYCRGNYDLGELELAPTSK